MSSVKERLATAIRDADAESRSRLRMDREGSAEAEAAFKPVRQAAVELSDELKSIADINFTINPDSVYITLVDRALWFSYDANSHQFTGEESGHSWYDRERYATQFAWTDAEDCIDAMIRLCAQYFRMARALKTALKSD